MQTEAIVIKKLDQGEHGEIIHLYTRHHGKVVALAKGLKRKTSKQAAHLEPFNLIDCRLIAPKAQTGFPLIASAHSRETFPDIKNTLPKLALGFYLLEMVDQLIYEHEADTALWQWLGEQLKQLASSSDESLLNGNREQYLALRKVELMNILGYQGASTETNGMDYTMQDLVNRPARALQFVRSLPRGEALRGLGRDSSINELI